MIKDSAPRDSITAIASEISGLYGQDELLHEYYSYIGDYYTAYGLLKKEHAILDNEFGNKSRNNAIFQIHRNQEDKIATARFELKFEKERNFWIITSALLFAVILVLLTIYLVHREKIKTKELLAIIGILSHEKQNLRKANMEEVPLLKTIFGSLDKLYSDYYCTAENDRKGIIGKMGETIGRLREDEEFLQELEKEINRCSDNLLDAVYAEHEKPTKTQRRLVAYLYFGLSTEAVCALLDITPSAYYSRKSRLLDRIESSSSSRKDELLQAIRGAKC